MENKREFTCIVCPVGCHLTVTSEDDQYKVTGNTCKRGENYAQQEMIAPKRNIASTIRVEDQHKVKAPIKVGDILIEDVLGTGSNIVATRNIGKK